MPSTASSNKPLVPILGVHEADSGEASRPRKHSYGQILKSSALVGGSAFLNIGIGIIRNKVMAILLGPAGFGLLGVYNSIADLTRTLAGMGLNSSGVRQIAEATSTGDTHTISRTITVLRRVALLLGILGAILLAVLCLPISRFSFESYDHAVPIAALGLAVFFASVSSGQIALLQGMRRIADLAQANVLGAFLGSACSIGVIFFFWRAGDGKLGVVPALICVAAMSALGSWFYSRKIKVEPVVMRWADISDEVFALLKLGFVFMSSALLSMGVAYLVRIIVLRKIGEDAAGFYQSAYSLGGLYVGFILQSMGADFFPRLTAVAKDNRECNRLVNEQAEVGLLLAGPGILGSLTFAPAVILVFYSSKFGPAVEILRWICLGMVLRVASWPMSFILLAKGARKPYLACEIAAAIIQILLVWLGVEKQGLNGTGIAFFGSFVFYWILVYFVVRSVGQFRWSNANKRLAMLLIPLVTALFVAWYFVPGWAVFVAGSIATLCMGIHSLRRLCALVPLERFPGPVRKILVTFKLGHSTATRPEP